MIQPQDPLTGAPPISGTKRLFDGTPIPGWSHPLRKAASEALLAGAFVLADVQRTMSTWSADAPAKASEERFRKALEQLAEALA